MRFAIARLWDNTPLMSNCNQLLVPNGVISSRGLLVFIITASIYLTSCNLQEPVRFDGEISVSAEMVRSTEITIRVRGSSNIHPMRIRLQEPGGDTIASWNCFGASFDTVLRRSNLSPQQDASCKAYISSQTGHDLDSSAVLSVETMGITSHSFQWNKEAIGLWTSYLSDVSIVDDSCVWVVGNIYRRSQSDPSQLLIYGAAYWLGDSWRLLEVPYHIDSSTVMPGELVAVHAVSRTRVYAASYGELLMWDGSSWSTKAIFYKSWPFTHFINSVRAVDEHLVYCGAADGVVYAVTDTSWTEISLAPGLDCVDLYSARNTRTGRDEVLAAFSAQGGGAGRALFSLDGLDAQPVLLDGIGSTITGLWFEPGSLYFAAGDVVYTSVRRSTNLRWAPDSYVQVSGTAPATLRGNELNDILLLTQFGQLVHFNGVSLRQYPSVDASGGVYRRIDFKGNLAVGVGEESGFGLIGIGLRR
jgi:hypothetical protein